MTFAIFEHRRVRQGIALVLLTGTLFCIFPVNHPFARYWASNAVFVALGYLGLGLFFFVINRTRLMFVCMGCCAAICFYYLETTQEPLKSSWPDPALVDSLKVEKYSPK